MSDKPRELSFFGANVKRLRRERGITQQALSEVLGMTRTSITNIETGRQNVPTTGLLAIARALDCEPAELLRQVEMTVCPTCDGSGFVEADQS